MLSSFLSFTSFAGVWLKSISGGVVQECCPPSFLSFTSFAGVWLKPISSGGVVFCFLSFLCQVAPFAGSGLSPCSAGPEDASSLLSPLVHSSSDAIFVRAAPQALPVLLALLFSFVQHHLSAVAGGLYVLGLVVLVVLLCLD